MKKTILITGSSGQLGNSLSSYLFESFDIISTSRTGKKNFLKLDITNKKNVNAVLKAYNPDIIINCSAITDVDFCENNHSLCRKVHRRLV